MRAGARAPQVRSATSLQGKEHEHRRCVGSAGSGAGGCIVTHGYVIHSPIPYIMESPRPRERTAHAGNRRSIPIAASCLKTTKVRATV
jgi:hypothetical protein